MITMKEQRIDHRLALCVFSAASVIFLLTVYSAFPIWIVPTPVKHAKSPYVAARIGSHWRGWSSIEQLIVFGDSWSSTGFEIDGERPSASNAIGNPAYPGRTVANGPNWVDYLTYERNESRILTYDFAVGGATIDNTLIKPNMPDFYLRSFKTQVEDAWEKHNWPWTADTSLFAVGFGVNDITAYTPETRGNFEAEFKVFADLMDQLYAFGARNFLVFNAPPLDRAPIYSLSGIEDWKVVIQEWNFNVTAMANNFSSTYNETTMFFFDLWKLYDAVMADPCIFEESCGFEVTTDSCLGYIFGAETPDYKDPDCPYSVDKYLWINTLHPSTKMHNATARAVYDALG